MNNILHYKILEYFASCLLAGFLKVTKILILVSFNSIDTYDKAKILDLCVISMPLFSKAIPTA